MINDNRFRLKIPKFLHFKVNKHLRNIYIVQIHFIQKQLKFITVKIYFEQIVWIELKKKCFLVKSIENEKFE